MWVCLLLFCFFSKNRLDYPICLNSAFLLRSKQFLTSPTPAKAKGKEEKISTAFIALALLHRRLSPFTSDRPAAALLCALWVERSEGSLRKLCASSRPEKTCCNRPSKKREARFAQVPSKTAEFFSFLFFFLYQTNILQRESRSELSTRSYLANLITCWKTISEPGAHEHRQPLPSCLLPPRKSWWRFNNSSEWKPMEGRDMRFVTIAIRACWGWTTLRFLCVFFVCVFLRAYIEKVVWVCGLKQLCKDVSGCSGQNKTFSDNKP